MTRAGRAAGGQTLPLFAIFAPLVLAFTALGLDAAQAFVERRNAQGAADLASLAGARLLHDDVTPTEQQAARDRALAVALANGYPAAQVAVTTPYAGDKERILVTIDSGVDTFFMPILDLLVPGDYANVEVDARAVAYGGYEETEGLDFAILALEGCPSNEKTVDISGSTTTFTGRVHSNSDLYISGSGNTFNGATTSVSGCTKPRYVNGGSGNTFDPSPGGGSSPATAVTNPFADKTYSYFCPPSGLGFTGPSSWDLASNGAWWVGGSKSSKTLKAGVYCTTGTIKLGDSDIRIEDVEGAGVTFVAGQQVEISGSNFRLTPYKDNMLFVSYGSTDVALKVSGSGGSWSGYLYAPNGTAEVSGSANLAIKGGIVGKRVKLNGSSMSIDGTFYGGGPGDAVYALTE